MSFLDFYFTLYLKQDLVKVLLRPCQVLRRGVNNMLRFTFGTSVLAVENGPVGAMLKKQAGQKLMRRLLCVQEVSANYLG